ncbi:MAG TPA: aldose 1-epimerase [Bryobacteraceae bacterium]|nr:aldose 1-epimerase [Bryobacteraceae bacterium]
MAINSGTGFSAETARVEGVNIVRLADAPRGMEVCLAPEIGNMAYAFTVGGKDLLWVPFSGPAALRAQPALCGIPFLAPWANRIDGDAYWANGKQFLLNPALGNLRRDSHQKPIHGLLNFSPAWTLVAAGADARSAYATSRLAFFRHSEMMAQFPFAHSLTMTYRLEDGSLIVETSLENHASEPMPVALGFHPYFQLSDAPREQWNVHLAARDHLRLDENLIPTGAREPVRFADPHPLRERQLDDVFTGLVRDPGGMARFWVQGDRQRITVEYGPKYTVAVVYAPDGNNFICFEPMAAITNAFNLAHHGRYAELQSLPPGAEWREIFRVTPSGF